MGLYFGSSEKLKINLNSVIYKLNLYSETPITNNTRLLSSNNLVLRDANGLYLTIESDENA